VKFDPRCCLYLQQFLITSSFKLLQRPSKVKLLHALLAISVLVHDIRVELAFRVGLGASWSNSCQGGSLAHAHQLDSVPLHTPQLPSSLPANIHSPALPNDIQGHRIYRRELWSYRAAPCALASTASECSPPNHNHRLHLPFPRIAAFYQRRLVRVRLLSVSPACRVPFTLSPRASPFARRLPAAKLDCLLPTTCDTSPAPLHHPATLHPLCDGTRQQQTCAR
jgi:hypothetical protein